MSSLRIACVFLCAVLANVTSAETTIRWNQVGYAPSRAIRLVIMSESDLTGETWRIEDGDGLLREGKLEPSAVGFGPHTALPFNHTLDLPDGLGIVKDGFRPIHVDHGSPVFSTRTEFLVGTVGKSR